MPYRSCLVKSALFLLSVSPAIALVPPSRNPALVIGNGLPVANSSALEYDLPLTNLNASPQCDGAHYGRNLRQASCDEVLDFFDPIFDDPVMEFGQRGHYAGTYKLPMRWLSSDGRCALDVVHKPGVWQDKTHKSKVWDAAKAIVAQCVRGAPASRNAGGAVGELGDNGGLIVLIRSYFPRVSCTAPASQPRQLMQGECREVVSTIPVSDQNLVYGMPPQQDLEVTLPHYFTSAQTECMGLLTAPQNTKFVSSPYDIWAAASAIENMCVRNWKTGVAKVVETPQGSLLLALTKVKWRLLGSNSTSGNSSGVLGLGGGTGGDRTAIL